MRKLDCLPQLQRTLLADMDKVLRHQYASNVDLSHAVDALGIIRESRGFRRGQDYLPTPGTCSPESQSFQGPGPYL
jgi:hypothetical protein